MSPVPERAFIEVRVDRYLRTLEAVGDETGWQLGPVVGPIAGFSWRILDQARRWLASNPMGSFRVFADSAAPAMAGSVLVLGRVRGDFLGFQVPNLDEGIHGFWGGEVGITSIIGVLDAVAELRPAGPPGGLVASAGTSNRSELDRKHDSDPSSLSGPVAATASRPLWLRRSMDGPDVAPRIRNGGLVVNVDGYETVLFVGCASGQWMLTAVDEAEAFFSPDLWRKAAHWLSSASVYEAFCLWDDMYSITGEREPCALFIVALKGCGLLGYAGLGGSWSGVFDLQTLRQIFLEIDRGCGYWKEVGYDPASADKV